MEIYLSDYLGLVDGFDYTLALFEALTECKKRENVTLHLGGGELHFYKRYAYNREYYISNNDSGVKSIAFPLIGFKNFTIDGDGADLNFHGQVLPFVIDNSENITLKNFTVDYPYPFFFQAEITSASPDYTELTFDKEHFGAKARDFGIEFSSPDGWKYNSTTMLNCEFERATKMPSAYIPPYIADLSGREDDSFLSGMHRYLKATQKSENRIALEGRLGHTHTVGNYFVCTFGGRECPGIFGNRSKNILIEDVTLYSTASMGVVCQICENVTLRRLKTVPREGSGRMLSVNADATHFVNCTGFVRYEECVFTNMLDDAGNCHGNYLKFIKKINSHTMLLSFGHYQQRGVNFFDAGDKIAVVDNKTMVNTAYLTVVSAQPLSAELLRLETEEELPEMQAGFGVADITKMPELYIYNCVTGANRPRGFLPSTWRKTEIVGNTFYNMMCGLHFTGDCNDWFESGAVGDVLIKGNSFKNSAYTGGACIVIGPHVLEGTAPYHRNIIIEENTFELAEERFLSAEFADNLVMRNNKFILNEELPKHGKCGENGIYIKNCSNTSVEPPEKC